MLHCSITLVVSAARGGLNMQGRKMTQSMVDILELVRAGKLGDATAAIQRNVGTADLQTAPDTAAGMKDITPKARMLAPGSASKKSTVKPTAARASSWTRHDGAVPYYLYTPTQAVATAPLIVMLHGCTQSPKDFATGTGMNAAAERIGAHVIWPEQNRSANANLCWNWFDPKHQTRGGEAAAIAQVAAYVRTNVVPKASGIHVAGLSAGGAMAAILGAQYSDVFASVCVHSGLPAGSARDMGSAFAAMNTGGQARMSVKVPTMVFHGTTDATVKLANGQTLAADFASTAKPRVRTSTIGGRRVTVTRSTTEDQSAASEFWQIDGLGHAWSGGHAAGSYADPKGPSATDEAIRFFQAVGHGVTD